MSFFSSIRTQIFLILILFILASAIIFRIVASEQASAVLLNERAEKINDINVRIPDTFKVILETTIQDYKTPIESTNGKTSVEGLNTHIRNFIKNPLQDRTNNLAKIYESSFFGFYSIDGPAFDNSVIVESNSYKNHMWYPRQIRLSLAFPDPMRWEQTAGINNWYPPIAMGVVAQSYENLDRDLGKIENSINTPLLMVLMIGILSALLLSVFISWKVLKLKRGILSLSSNLDRTIRVSGGELGEIAHAANRLALDLRTSRSRSERVLDSVSTGIVVIGEDTRVIEANPSSCEILARDINEIAGTKTYNLGEIGQLVDSVLGDVIDKNMIWNSGSIKINTGKATKYVNIIAVPVENAKPREAIVAISDVTESITNTMINERDASLARLGLFTMGIAHEVRNPLTSIKGFVQLLDKKLVGRDENKYLRPVLKEIERIENLITELMNASKPQPLKAEIFRFTELAEKLITNHWEQLQDDGITIKLNIEENIELYADPNRLYQILLNLMLNSRDAMPAGGKITISAHNDNDWFVMNFTDTGMGISQEDAHKIFTPFFTTKASGTGLGLSICDQIVKAHSGHISFTSDENGTTFTVKLPQKLVTEE